jgi:membrane-associated phospholipid phosphatase
MVFDNDIRKAVQRNRNPTTDDIFKAIAPFGAEYSLAVLGGFYVGGEIFKDPRSKAVALDGLAASIIASGLIDQSLKHAIGRSRPNKGRGPYDFHPFSGSDSFASGHTTQAFAVATVISEHYESLGVKVTSYGLASAVGYSRMNSDAHWASSVLAGAAIGTFVGEVVVRFNNGHRHVAMMPLIGPHFKGAELVWSF